MDTLGEQPAFDLRGTDRETIYARNTAHPSSFIEDAAAVTDSFVAEGCEVRGRVQHSIISTGCTIGDGACVQDSVIMPNVVVENGAVIHHAIIGEGCTVCAGARIGEAQSGEVHELKISVVGKEETVAAGTVIAAGEII